MNTLRTLVAATALAGLVPAATAASSVDLTVSGAIVPASCTPILSSANINFGKISAADLNVDTPTILFAGNPRWSTLSVNCVGPTLYGIRGVDNRAATVGNNSYATPYGLGLSAKGEKLGAHYLEIYPVRSTIDGQPAFVSIGDATGTSWGASGSSERGIRNYGPLLGFTDRAGVTSGPIPVKSASYALGHYLGIAPAKQLTLTEQATLDGSATIEVVYL